jgi:ribonuclease H-related protein
VRKHATLIKGRWGATNSIHVDRQVNSFLFSSRLTGARYLIQNPFVVNYKFEGKLRTRAEEFILALKAVGLEGVIIEDSFREYAVKVSVLCRGEDIGAALLNYSPKSDSFSLQTDELKDRSLAPQLRDCWKEQPQLGEQPDSIYDIYVDGSFINGATGYGAVVLRDGNVVDELSGPVDASEVNDTRQVAGELVAAKEALNWCRKHSVNEVSIYYDYLGVEKWATREWKANQPLTQEYARFVGECPTKIHWRKVDSHTGNRWNDRADALAKKGAGSIQAAVGKQDMVSDLMKKTTAWIEFLMVRGIDARFDRVYNEQFARVCIMLGDAAVGIFDLYNTKRKRFSPYLHNFLGEDSKSRIETLWKEFLASANETL